VPVQAVVGDVELAAREPGQLVLGLVPGIDRVPLVEPVQRLGHLGPESVGVVYRAIVHLLVLVECLDICALAQLLGRVDLLYLWGFFLIRPCHLYLLSVNSLTF
jgi:hypothetical protein